MSTSNSSKIGLLDNACHSLKRGYEMLNKGQDEQDPLALKEAIIWVHHGIELFIKQLLVQSNEYLIFENIDEAVRKLAYLRGQPGMRDANVLDLFDFSEGIYTVGFGKLIDRAAIMLNIAELARGSKLREKIDELTSYRNKIVHFTVEVNLEEVINLLGELIDPLLSLLERDINDIEFSTNCIMFIRRKAKPATDFYRDRYEGFSQRIEAVLNKFDGQELPGNLFGREGKIKVPKFYTVEKETGPKDVRVDFFAKSDKENWLIETKRLQKNQNIGHFLFRQLDYFRGKIDNDTKLWLIILAQGRFFTKGMPDLEHFFISSESDLEILEHMI